MALKIVKTAKIDDLEIMMKSEVLNNKNNIIPNNSIKNNEAIIPIFNNNTFTIHKVLKYITVTPNKDSIVITGIIKNIHLFNTF